MWSVFLPNCMVQIETRASIGRRSGARYIISRISLPPYESAANPDIRSFGNIAGAHSCGHKSRLPAMVASRPILRLAAVLAACRRSRRGASAQDKPGNWLTGCFNRRPPASVPATAARRAEWSGQSGASGDPLMTADAIRAAAAEFRQLPRGLWPRAARRGVSRADFDRYTARADARPAHHGSARRPAGIHQVVLGLSRSAGERRPHRAGPRAAGAISRRPSMRWSATYGVDRNIIAAIWGVETNYGTLGGDRSGDPLDRDARLHRPPAAIISARSFCPRWKSCSAATFAPDRLIGSWAGAFGPTQFMPTSFKRYAVDFDGDGRRDVVELDPRHHRLDRQQSEEGRLGQRPDLGLRSRGAAEFQLSCSPTVPSR